MGALVAGSSSVSSSLLTRGALAGLWPEMILQKGKGMGESDGSR
jgi:hypothetical protein